ncbi:cupredoxin domain-containing protein [Halostella litorea]|uniref:cupredoxin domain-containing protein n=1 Tax=Halostella litorea TaxID=2528831 RepID=UPI0010931A96|nr:PGF-CTERM sorting domain-containing protein [Halostella litorea]
MTDTIAASRRGVLAATAAALALPATAAARPSSRDAQAETIRLESDLSGWQGVAPESIAGEENPTLQLEPGVEYEIVWENADGVSHNLYVEDASGDAVANTESVGEEGATRSVTFTATEAVASYRCRIHGSMTGDVQVGSETTTPGTTADSGTSDTTTSDATTAGGATTADSTTTDGGATTDDGTTMAGDETTTADGSGDSGGTDGDSDGGGQPGFGVAAAVAGLVGALGLRRRRR